MRVWLPEKLKLALKRTPMYSALQWSRINQEVKEWEAKGRPIPSPSSVKRAEIRKYCESFACREMVETGTLYGETVAALRHQFDHLYSIEVDDTLFQNALNRFAGDSKITILNGDSATMIKTVLDQINVSTLFWLDGHYSGGNTGRGVKDTPIEKELFWIFQHPIREHVLLIDDARCFVGADDYPTLGELQQMILKYRPDWVIEVKDDIIRAHRKR